MVMEKIASLVEEYRVLTGFSAYPYIAEINGEHIILWFNYLIKDSEKGISAFITDAFSTSDGNDVKKISVSLIKDINTDNMKEPEIDYPEYLKCLEKVFDSYSSDAMEALLEKSEVAFLSEAYDEVAKLFN